MESTSPFKTRTPEADALIAEVQDEPAPDGQEEIDLVADRAGTYTIATAPAARHRRTGSYAIRVASRRAATPADRSRQDVRRRREPSQRNNPNRTISRAPRLLLEQALALTEARGSGDRKSPTWRPSSPMSTWTSVTTARAESRCTSAPHDHGRHAGPRAPDAGLRPVAASRGCAQLNRPAPEGRSVDSASPR